MRIQKTLSMKERVAEHGGLFRCAVRRGENSNEQELLVRARSASEARSRLEKAFGCVLAAFAVKSYVC